MSPCHPLRLSLLSPATQTSTSASGRSLPSEALSIFWPNRSIPASIWTFIQEPPPSSGTNTRATGTHPHPLSPLLYSVIKKTSGHPVTEAHTCNPSPRAEAGELLQVKGQSGLHNECQVRNGYSETVSRQTNVSSLVPHTRRQAKGSGKNKKQHVVLTLNQPPATKTKYRG